MAFDVVIVSDRRHAETARALAAGMRSYRLPGGVVLVDPLDYRSILLETEETPLDDAGRQALIDAGYLIVLFSPEAAASESINERLNFYEKQCGRETIVPVIADGEPADIFPPMFIQHRTVEKILADGTIVRRDETIEPVAADLRADTPKRRREMMDYEKVRIIATILGLHPDDLERRAARRRRQRILAAAAVVGSLLLAAAILFAVLGYRAKTEGDIAAKQTAQTGRTISRLTEELPEAFPEAEAQERIAKSVDDARQALEAAGLGSYLTDGEEGER